jgi:hypothetical protein
VFAHLDHLKDKFEWGRIIMKAKKTRFSEARPPKWVDDPVDQQEWSDRFLEILRKDYASSDRTVAAILSDGRLSKVCAIKIRSYVNKEFTAYLYAQRKARGTDTTNRLELTVRGLNAGISLSRNGGKQEFIATLEPPLRYYSKALDNCKEAFATKRHGRDRDHGILQECHTFLEQRLGQAVTYATLATLVNAGYEANGDLPEEPIDEGLVGRNLANFKKRNPFWSPNNSRS